MGFSIQSPQNALGLVKNREFLILGLRFERLIAQTGRFAVGYTADLIPLAVVTKNPTQDDINSLGPDIFIHQEAILDSPIGRVTYGAGLAPIGLQFYVTASERLSLFSSTSAGFLTFVENVPLPNARKVNATFDVGAGAKVMMGDRWIMVVGYKFHHMSNIQTALTNPGLNTDIFYIGISR